MSDLNSRKEAEEVDVFTGKLQLKTTVSEPLKNKIWPELRDELTVWVWTNQRRSRKGPARKPAGSRIMQRGRFEPNYELKVCFLDFTLSLMSTNTLDKCLHYLYYTAVMHFKILCFKHYSGGKTP